MCDKPILDSTSDLLPNRRDCFCFSLGEVGVTAYHEMVQLSELVEKGRHNRKVLLFIVYVALFLDNMLLTTVGKGDDE